MSATLPNIIRHVSLDLQYKGKVNGWEIQEEAKQWLNDLFNKLEPELEKISGDKDWLQLDQVNIEIDVNGGHWKDDAINQAASQILDKLKLKRQMVFQETKNDVLSQQQHFGIIFLHYLKHGNLPWYANNLSAGNWEQEVEKLFDGIGATFFLQLNETLRENASAIQRLIRAVSAESLVNALQKNIDLLETEQKNIMQDAVSLIVDAKQHTKKEALTKSIFTYFLYTITGSEMLAVPTSLLQEIQLDKAFESVLQKQFFASKAFISLQQISLQQIPVAQAKEKIEKDVYNLNENELNTGKENAGNQQESNIKKSDKNKLREEPFTNEQGEGIFLSNAGLVIIAAYLPRLFENLGWWKDHKWKDRNAAVCMVQYLATGQPVMEEFELVLPKVLCGMQPDEVIDPAYFLLTEQMQQEATGLLSSVISYWSVLKDTSTDGLRGSFLVRDGKLWKDENNWYLTVEKKGYDMLLQQIPWNISMIQLPWMDEMLRTNWI
jgi:hypothetical protein